MNAGNIAFNAATSQLQREFGKPESEICILPNSGCSLFIVSQKILFLIRNDDLKSCRALVTIINVESQSCEYFIIIIKNHTVTHEDVIKTKSARSVIMTDNLICVLAGSNKLHNNCTYFLCMTQCYDKKQDSFGLQTFRELEFGVHKYTSNAVATLCKFAKQLLIKIRFCSFTLCTEFLLPLVALAGPS
jgi:hypothetical protein